MLCPPIPQGDCAHGNNHGDDAWFRIPALAALGRIAALGILAAASAGCSSVERDWELAKSTDSPDSYRVFLDQHANSRYSGSAKKAVQCLRDWEDAEADGSVAAFRAFSDEYPRAKQSAVARQRIEQLKWEAASRTNSVSGYQAFLDAHPGSKHADAAREELQERQARQRAIAHAGIVEKYVRRVDVVVTKAPQTVATGEVLDFEWETAPHAPNAGFSFVIAKVSFVSPPAGIRVSSGDVLLTHCGETMVAADRLLGAPESGPFLDDVDLGPWSPSEVRAFNAYQGSGGSEREFRYMFVARDECIREARFVFLGKEFVVTEHRYDN